MRHQVGAGAPAREDASDAGGSAKRVVRVVLFVAVTAHHRLEIAHRRGIVGELARAKAAPGLAVREAVVLVCRRPGEPRVDQRSRRVDSLDVHRGAAARGIVLVASAICDAGPGRVVRLDALQATHRAVHMLEPSPVRLRDRLEPPSGVVAEGRRASRHGHGLELPHRVVGEGPLKARRLGDPPRSAERRVEIIGGAQERRRRRVSVDVAKHPRIVAVSGRGPVGVVRALVVRAEHLLETAAGVVAVLRSLLDRPNEHVRQIPGVASPDDIPQPTGRSVVQALRFRQARTDSTTPPFKSRLVRPIGVVLPGAPDTRSRARRGIGGAHDRVIITYTSRSSTTRVVRKRRNRPIAGGRVVCQRLRARDRPAKALGPAAGTIPRD